MLICLYKQQLWLAKTNHVIYFSQPQLLFVQANEHWKACQKVRSNKDRTKIEISSACGQKFDLLLFLATWTAVGTDKRRSTRMSKGSRNTDREIFSKSYQVKPKSDCIYHFPIYLEPNERPFVVLNQSGNGKYNLISV